MRAIKGESATSINISRRTLTQVDGERSAIGSSFLCAKALTKQRTGCTDTDAARSQFRAEQRCHHSTDDVHCKPPPSSPSQFRDVSEAQLKEQVGSDVQNTGMEENGCQQTPNGTSANIRFPFATHAADEEEERAGTPNTMCEHTRESARCATTSSTIAHRRAQQTQMQQPKLHQWTPRQQSPSCAACVSYWHSVCAEGPPMLFPLTNAPSYFAPPTINSMMNNSTWSTLTTVTMDHQVMLNEGKGGHKRQGEERDNVSEPE